MSNLQQKPFARNPYKPYQFNHSVTFCKLITKTDEAGTNFNDFEPVFSLHFAPIKKTLNQKYQLIGTALENTRLIAIRHNDKVNDYQYVQINNEPFEIVDVSSDNTMYIAYDLLTLKQFKGNKHG